MQPCCPVLSKVLPMGDQLSYQKEVAAPLPTSTLKNEAARCLYFRSFFQIQEPRVVVSLTDQKDPFRIKYLLTQLTQREEGADRILQISLRQLTLFATDSGVSPKPPSSLGVHTSRQETFAFFGFRAEPGHKNEAQSLSISPMQHLGNRNSKLQKLVKP